MVHEVLARSLHARMEITDHGFGPQDLFTPHFHHHAQHPVRRGVRRAEVQDRGLVIGGLVVEVRRVDGHAFWQAQDAAVLGP